MAGIIMKQVFKGGKYDNFNYRSITYGIVINDLLKGERTKECKEMLLVHRRLKMMMNNRLVQK